MTLAETANLIVALKLDDSNFSGRLARANSQVGGFGRGLSQMGRGIGQVGAGLDKLATRAAVAAGAGLAAVVTTAISFEDAFAGVAKTVEASDEQLAALFEDFRGLARGTGIAFEEFARIGEIAGALGIATDSIDEFSLAIAKGSTATGISVDELADSLGRIGTVLDLDASTYETFLSTLVELGNKGASTEAEILEITQRFGGTARAAGLANDEILGLASAIASMGVEPEAAGSALSRIMTNFITETANGTDIAREFARVAGQDFQKFAGIVEDDTLGAVLEFLGGLQKLGKFERFKALEAAGITNVRDRDAIIKFVDGLGEVNRQLAVSAAEYGRVNALSTEFAKRQETTARQLAIVKENVRDAAFVVGHEMLPIIKDLSSELVTFLNEPGTRATIKDFADSLAGGIRGFVTELKGTDFSGLLSGLKVASDAAKVAFNAFRSLPPDIQAILVGAFALNKVSGGAIGDIVKGVGRIAIGGGLLGRGSFTNPMFVTVTNPSFGGGGPVDVGGFLKWVPAVVAAVVTPATLVAIAAFVASEQSRNFLTENNPFFDQGPIKQPDQSFFDIWANGLNEKAENALLTNLGQFNPKNRGGTPPMAGVPHIQELLMKGGLAALFPKGMKLPNTAMLQSGGGMLPNTAMSAIANTPIAVNKLSPILTRQHQSLQTLYTAVREGARTTVSAIERQGSPRIPVSVTVNTYVSGTMFAKQHSVTEVASGVRRNTLPS